MRYHKLILSVLTILLTFLLTTTQLFAAAGVPQMIPYAGTIEVKSGENMVKFNGNGQFKFAIISQGCEDTEEATPCTSLWSNDWSKTDGSEPTNQVTITVNNGSFSVKLGDISITNMLAIPDSVFAFPNDVTYLRIWFNDGVTGPQQLSPDRQLVSVPYAYRASTADNVGTGQIADGSITTAKIANGAVGSAQINTAQVQNRVGQTCAAGSSIRTVNADGTVVCETDDGNTYTAGTGINITGTAISVADNGVTTAKIVDGAVAIVDLAFDPATQIELDAHKGSGDHDSKYPAKTDLSNSGIINTIANPVDWTKLKSVPAGFADGVDDTGAGGPASDVVCIGCVDSTDIANNAVGSAQINDGTIANADISAAAAIVDSKLATIATAGKISSSALPSNAYDGRFFRIVETITIVASGGTVAAGSFGFTGVNCPAGYIAVGGGIDPENVFTMYVTSSAPTVGSTRTFLLPDGTQGSPNGWVGGVFNNSTIGKTFKISVICSR